MHQYSTQHIILPLAQNCRLIGVTTQHDNGINNEMNVLLTQQNYFKWKLINSPIVSRIECRSIIIYVAIATTQWFRKSVNNLPFTFRIECSLNKLQTKSGMNFSATKCEYKVQQTTAMRTTPTCFSVLSRCVNILFTTTSAAIPKTKTKRCGSFFFLGPAMIDVWSLRLVTSFDSSPWYFPLKFIGWTVSAYVIAKKMRRFGNLFLFGINFIVHHVQSKFAFRHFFLCIHAFIPFRTCAVKTGKFITIYCEEKTQSIILFLQTQKKSKYCIGTDDDDGGLIECSNRQIHLNKPKIGWME